jgi:predicted site-specific integrase-resolvase
MAKICNVPVKQIKKWIRSGDIEAIDLPGAGQIVEMEKFTQFLEKQRKPYLN